MVDDNKVQAFSAYLSEVQDHVAEVIKVFEMIDEPGYVNIERDIFLGLMTEGAENFLFQNTLNLKY